MYYDNKSTFYVRQYGPAIIVSLVSIILISSGVFIYAKTSNIDNPFNKDTEIGQVINTKTSDESIESNEDVAQETTDIVEEAALKDITEVKYFENLPTLRKSKEVTVTNVSVAGDVIVELDGDRIEVTLIGVDFKYSSSSVNEIIKSDLLNKKVKIAFDKLRTSNGKNYAYIFVGKSLYNAELLKTGLVTLKTERQNIQLNGELASAQAYARQNSLGVWKK